MRRILVTGSRNWTRADVIAWELGKAVGGALREGCSYEDIVLVHGACPTGADALADRIARDYRLRVEAHPADWATHGKAAGPLRNQEMVDLGADICLAFPLGDSRGTRDCMRRAWAAGIPLVDLGDD